MASHPAIVGCSRRNPALLLNLCDGEKSGVEAGRTSPACTLRKSFLSKSFEFLLEEVAILLDVDTPDRYPFVLLFVECDPNTISSDPARAGGDDDKAMTVAVRPRPVGCVAALDRRGG